MSVSDQGYRALPKHEFVAGRLALDFCNTLSRTPLDFDWDRASNPRDFLSWAQRCGIRLERAPTTRALARLQALREALANVFDAVVDEHKPAAIDLKVLNTELAHARMAERLVPTDHGFVLQDGATDAVDRFRHAIVCEAVEMLTDNTRRIKRCPDHECLWLFYDGSKNLSRRWCAMDDCGTRYKVRRFRGREGTSQAT
ncbi:ABATE domain-containing protein [Mesorhizobium sp. KR9-304]|uniref:CGNR zinc finger domain-containing protein n=1 Tax=Mesorhizobium sp. KR9-304 TaxID=3156614 RepID=UPI0032B5CD6B